MKIKKILKETNVQNSDLDEILACYKNVSVETDLISKLKTGKKCYIFRRKIIWIKYDFNKENVKRLLKTIYKNWRHLKYWKSNQNYLKSTNNQFKKTQ